MEELLSGLRAAAESTRVRILFILAHGEANVSELTQILGQSQPRVSRHLKLMAEAGLISRHKEGNWVLFRLREEDMGGALARAIVDLLPGSDPVLAGDLARLEEIRSRRAEAASRYFAENAARWEQLRSLHVREEDVEQAMVKLAGSAPIRLHVDLGTGTGAIAITLLAERPDAIGVATDLSPDALAVARENAARLGAADRLTLLEGSWFTPVSGAFDIILSNPPYIPADEIAGLAPDVRNFDPALALSGGTDGLDPYRTIAAGAGVHLDGGGHVLVEIGAGQAGDVETIFAAHRFRTAGRHSDLGGHIRCLGFNRVEK